MNLRLNNEILELLGYQIIDLFNISEINYFEKLFNEFSEEETTFSGLEYSLFNKKIEYKKHIEQEINKIISTKVNFLSPEIESFSGSFINKPPAFESEFSLHQDWSYTDETKHKNCYTLWAPLQDVDEKNGCLYIIPKSHLFFQNYRSSTLETIRISINENDEIKNRCVQIHLKVGQALLFKQAIFHGSFPNKSNKNRVALTCIVKHKLIPLYYYHKLNENKIIKYEFEKDFFTSNLLEITKNIIPLSFKKRNEIDYTHKVITKEQLIEKLKKLE